MIKQFNLIYLTPPNNKRIAQPLLALGISEFCISYNVSFVNALALAGSGVCASLCLSEAHPSPKTSIDLQIPLKDSASTLQSVRPAFLPRC